MKLAAIVLMHHRPQQAIELIDLLLQRNISVVIHVDANATDDLLKSVQSALAGRGVEFADRVRCAWGEFSIVQATLNALLTIARIGWCPDYVMLLSGADFPIRPHGELVKFLDTHRGFEFIQSCPITQPWVRCGPQAERLEHYFPAGWRASPSLFDLSFSIQSVAGIKRRLPDGISPYIGSQWWALTWPTCVSVLDFVRSRPDISAFFSTTLVPDESYFQSLVRTLVSGDRIANSSLTYSEFDEDGQPLTLHNDHLHYLERQPFLFARKFSPHAGFLRKRLTGVWLSEDNSNQILQACRVPDGSFEHFVQAERHGSPGLPLWFKAASDSESNP